MSTPSKNLSPTDLAKLEHAFATDPASDAYRPLAEAYLTMGRFMEAMVVCKKGVKAHPTRPEPRLLLARVYADQGKDKKAIEELNGALQVAPADRTALKMVATLELKNGETEAGRAHLNKAYELDSSDAELPPLFQRYRLDPPRRNASAPSPSAQASPPANGVAASGPPRLEPAAPGPQTGPVVAGPGARAHARSASGNIPVQRQGQAAPGSVRTVSRSMPRVDSSATNAALDARAEADDRLNKRAQSSMRKATLGLIVAMVVVLPAYKLYGTWRSSRAREVKTQLDNASRELKHDNFAAYQAATEAANGAIELDSASLAAHSYLAYTWTLRWGEHGGGDEARAKAEEHLEAAKDIGGETAHFLAADALFKAYSGQAGQVVGPLVQRVEGLEKEGRASSTLNLALGVIQTSVGDLEGALASLTRAQELAPSDARIYAALGTLYRRRGQERLARYNFGMALRYEKTHPESMLGAALSVLEAGPAGYEEEVGGYQMAASSLKLLVNMEPPPSPRQLASAHMARAWLVARVVALLPDLPAERQREILEKTSVPNDRAKARAEITSSEQQAFSLDAKNPELRLMKGRRLAVEGQIDLGADEIRAAIRQDPSRIQLYVELARLLMTRPGGEEAAQKELNSALKVVGENPRLLVVMGETYRKQGRSDDAMRTFRKAIELAKNAAGKSRNPEARLQLAGVLREGKDYGSAMTELDLARTEFGGQPGRVAATYTELARVHEEQGERAKAEEAFKRALTVDPDYAEGYFYYARFLAGGPDRSAAREVFDQYLEREPRGPLAAEARQRLASL
ncbi:MAG: tetratricopeptide repeat protein [Myxococcaceae bacterium]